MNKGLYLLFDEIGNPRKSGIWNKIKGQCNAYRTAGWEMDRIYFRTRRELFLNDRRILRLPSRQLFFRALIFRKILQLCRSNAYPFVYIRYGKSDRHFIWYLRKLKMENMEGPCVMIEFPTFPYDPEMDPGNWVEKIINRQDRKWRDQLHKYVDHAASIVRLDQDILGIPTFHMDNGVEVETIPLSGSERKEGFLRIIGVANVSRWHAWDRVIRGMHGYYGQKDVSIDVSFMIVGSGSATGQLQDYVKELGLNDHVRFTGPLTGPALDEVFSSADLAMGSLGMHRIGLTTGSVLKLREYTARGLPSVIGYMDSTITDKEKFVYRIPADESPLDILKLIGFFLELNVSQQEIRDFARMHFSWSNVLKPVLERIPDTQTFT